MNVEDFRKLPRESGIYFIRNKKNGHIYIGQSRNIQHRFLCHHQCDYTNPHTTIYNSKLYIAMRKYGLDEFECGVLELCDEDKLNEREMYWIAHYDSYHKGYNMTLGGTTLPDGMTSQAAREKSRNKTVGEKLLQSDNHPRAKLSNEEVLHIRERYTQGETVREIYPDYANLYSIDSFRRIVFGGAYKYLPMIPKDKIRHAAEGQSVGKVSHDVVRKLREEWKCGKYTYRQLAEKYNVTTNQAYHIINGQTYYNVH